jgi:hypothetical protein
VNTPVLENRSCQGEVGTIYYQIHPFLIRQRRDSQECILDQWTLANDIEELFRFFLRAQGPEPGSRPTCHDDENCGIVVHVGHFHRLEVG